MDLYSPIFTHRSMRDYDMTPLNAETIQQIEAFISVLCPLLPKAEFSHTIVGPDEIKGLGICKAPHYLLISGKD